MPIFGLVWVASWVSCFFSSSQALLQTPAYLSRVLPIQASYDVNGSRSGLLDSSSYKQQPFGHFAQQLSHTQVVSLAGAFDTTQALSAPLNFFGAFKDLFSGFQRFATATATPPVVVSKVERSQVSKVSTTHAVKASLGFGQCLPVERDDADGDTPEHVVHNQSLFQVKVKNYVVSAAPSQQQATKIAQRLEQVLRDSKAPLDRLQPGIVDGTPVGKLGDRVLFTVSKQVADQWNCNPEVLAIQWVNDLRVALAKAPLLLAEAQAKMYSLKPTGQYIEGMASWYGPYFHGRQTATGETFNQNDFTAAHRSLPFDTYLKVTNVANGKSVIVRVNDRGPYFEDRTLDLSREAAHYLDSETHGVVSVEAEIMQPTKAMAVGQAIAQRL